MVINSIPSGISISLEFPLKDGRYYVTQGGNDQTLNHHHMVSAQKYALDIVKINEFGFRAKKVIPEDLHDYYIYDIPIYSPIDGTVIEAVDEFDDLTPPKSDPTNPAGNYLAIKVKDCGKIILLAHLKSKSLLVGKDMQVLKGQILARVGNSGNTSEPHLHIHSLLLNSGDLLFTGQGIPMIFNDRFLIRNNVVIDP